MIVDFLLANEMTESIEQRCGIKFCQKLGNDQTETIQKIQQAFGDEALSQTQAKKHPEISGITKARKSTTNW